MLSSLMITAAYIGLQILSIPQTVLLPGWLNIYKEYPILNQGTIEGVNASFAKVSKEPHCVFLIAKTDEYPVAGIATGIPLAAYDDNAEYFKEKGLDPSDYFHINDAIILPPYQNKGIGSKLYKKLEKKARLWGYKGISVCTVKREKDHPLRPLQYKSSKKFWKRLGFTKVSLITKEAWPTIIDDRGAVEEQYENTLVWWTKELKA